MESFENWGQDIHSGKNRIKNDRDKHLQGKAPLETSVAFLFVLEKAIRHLVEIGRANRSGCLGGVETDVANYKVQIMNPIVWILLIFSALKPVQGSGYMIQTVGYFETRAACEVAAQEVKGAIKDQKSMLTTVCVRVSR